MSIFQISLTASVLIIAIVIIRSLALNKLPKSFFLALWGIAACRLLIPFEIPSSFSVFNAFNKVSTELQPITETPTIQVVTNDNAINDVPQVIPSLGKTISISPLEIIWLIGLVSIAIIFAIAYYKNYVELKTALPIKNNPMLDKWQNKQKLIRPFKILVSDKITTPIAFGIMKPRIVLHKSMNLNDEQLVQYVLAHELQHIKHFDMLWKIILMVVVCLHWFNPLVWAMYVLANRDLELACDEKVIRQFGEVTKSAYALSLISMAEHRSKFTPLYNGFSKNAVEERIVSIMKFKKTSVVALVLSLVLVTGIATAFATSAKAEKNSETPVVITDNTIAPNSSEQFIVRPTNIENEKYTQEEYDLIMLLKLKGYETMTVADFNSKIMNATEENDEAYRGAIENVVGGISKSDPNAPFILNTLRASIDENGSEHLKAFGTYRDPSFYGEASIKIEDADNHVDYSVYYKILDNTKLTVSERDKFMQDFMISMQDFVNSKSQEELKNRSDIQIAFSDELNRVAKQLSNDLIQVSSVEVLGIS